MGDLVNLRRFRKARGRAEAAAAATRNRATYGRPASERDAAAEELARLDRALDRHRRDRPAGPEEPAAGADEPRG